MRRHFVTLTATLLMVVLSLVVAMTTNRAGTFKMVTSSDGVELCAVDVPSNVELVPVDNHVQFGLKCLLNDNCRAYNIHQESGGCQADTRSYPDVLFAILKVYISLSLTNCLHQAPAGDTKSIGRAENVVK